MDAFEIINDTLVRLVREVWQLEERAITQDEFSDITNNDMHIIEAIGFDDYGSMSAVAKKLGITAGSLTIAINGLVNKKYVIRERAEADRRRVYIYLSEKGQRAYIHHATFHQRLTTAVLSKLHADEVPVLLKSLQSLNEFFEDCKAVKG